MSTATPANSSAITPGCGGVTALTGAGPSAIAAIRLRGAPAARFFERHIRARPDALARPGPTRGQLVDDAGIGLDEILLVAHASSVSPDYSIYLHGSPWLFRQCLQSAQAAGATASSTECVWAGADRLQSDAWGLLPQMRTLRGVRWLLNQPLVLRPTLNGILAAGSPATRASLCDALLAAPPRVEYFSTPLRLPLVGAPNAGKSTLLNALAGDTISIVSPTPGTTRDWIEADDELEGWPVRWIDTAGMRPTRDPLEAAGIEHARRVVSDGAAPILVIDGALGNPLDSIKVSADLPRPRVIAVTKCDQFDAERIVPELRTRLAERGMSDIALIAVSGVSGRGLAELRRAVIIRAGRAELADSIPTAFSPALRLALEAAAANPAVLCDYVSLQ